MQKGPLCEEGFVEAGDSAGEHQGVAGEAEPVGFEGPGERSESIAPRAARVISVSPLHRGGCVKSKHQVFFDILYKKGNALYLFILVFLLLSFGK